MVILKRCKSVSRETMSWRSSCTYLAGLIADDARMKPKDLQRWAENAYGGALPGATVAWVAAGSPHGWEIGVEVD